MESGSQYRTLLKKVPELRIAVFGAVIEGAIVEMQIAPAERISCPNGQLPGKSPRSDADIGIIGSEPRSIRAQRHSSFRADERVPNRNRVRNGSGLWEQAEWPGEPPLKRRLELRVAKTGEQIERHGGGAVNRVAG